MVRSQVRRGRPGRRLQSLGNPRINVYMALDVSCESPIRPVQSLTLVKSLLNVDEIGTLSLKTRLDLLVLAYVGVYIWSYRWVDTLCRWQVSNTVLYF